MRFNLIVNDWDRKAFLISHFSDTSYNMGGEEILCLKTVSTCHGNLCWGRGAAGARAGSDTAGAGAGAGRAERERARVMEEADLDTERLVQPAPATWSPHCPPHSPEASPQGGGTVRFLV